MASVSCLRYGDFVDILGLGSAKIANSCQVESLHTFDLSGTGRRIFFASTEDAHTFPVWRWVCLSVGSWAHEDLLLHAKDARSRIVTQECSQAGTKYHPLHTFESSTTIIYQQFWSYAARITDALGSWWNEVHCGVANHIFFVSLSLYSW